MPWICCTQAKGLDQRTIYINTDHVYRFESTGQGNTKLHIVGQTSGLTVNEPTGKVMELIEKANKQT
jgi:hypothetical protein